MHEQSGITRANGFVRVNDYFSRGVFIGVAIVKTESATSSKRKVQHRSRWEPWEWGWLSSRADVFRLCVFCKNLTFQPTLNLLNGWERCVTSAVAFRRAFSWTLTHQMLLPLIKKSWNDQFAGQSDSVSCPLLPKGKNLLITLST